MRPIRALLTSAAIAVAALCVGAPAAAGPSVWAKARDPDLERRTEAIAQAETMLLKARRARRDPRQDPGTSMKVLYLREAKEILEKAGAAQSKDRTMRLRYAEVLHLLGEHAPAVAIYESLLKRDLPPAIRLVVYSDLAFSYASLVRRADEIRAYTEALGLEAHAVARSTLLTNRAEAYMAIGELGPAIEGYRAALASLAQTEMQAGVTTLWGLAVALDRSGDLEEGLQAIRLARSYDPSDTLIRDRNLWTFDPDHDEHWYAALGHWSAARHAELGAARAEWYGRAVSAWEEYLQAAPADDRWAPIAKARLKQCEKERDSALRRAPRSAAAPTERVKPAPRPATAAQDDSDSDEAKAKRDEAKAKRHEELVRRAEEKRKAKGQAKPTDPMRRPAAPKP